MDSSRWAAARQGCSTCGSLPEVWIDSVHQTTHPAILHTFTAH